MGGTLACCQGFVCVNFSTVALARVDHLIFSVSDIDSAHSSLTETFPEAWPVGRFWPEGRTSGVALGGLNLELIQLDDSALESPVGQTLVFEPTTLQEAAHAMESAGVASWVFEKIEPNRELLLLRGFSEEAASVPQPICRNILPSKPDSLPFEFFVCDYSPFLKRWLSPNHPRLKTASKVTTIIYGTPAPDEARQLLLDLGYSGDIEISFEPYDERRVLDIVTSSGSLGWLR
jgi:hypothetical protein